MPKVSVVCVVSAPGCLTPLSTENNIKKSNIKMKKEKIQWKNQKWIPAPPIR